MRRQFVNDPADLVNEALEGFEAAQRGRIRWNRDPSYVVRADSGRRRGKVALVSGGGSGHEPLHVGYVGPGMLDAAVPGAVFASPTAIQIQAASRAADSGGGVVHIVKNYTGDVLNFRIAAELLEDDGIRAEAVFVDDDVASDTGDGEGPGRRGTAAVIAVEKLCGAAAERGDDLDEIVALGRRITSGARTFSVALAAGAHPGQGRPSFDLADDEIEFGVGIHGERARQRHPFAPVRDLVPEMVDRVRDPLGLGRGEHVIAIVNGLGSTHDLELYAIHRELVQVLAKEGIVIDRALVGTYLTSLDMAGCSITLIRSDDDLVDLWDAPVSTPALTW
ncbi:dihydroxyacetone kinase subunit DhaK [Marinactinospora thermotolerans]|uniref:Dihydroxyacetone kinase DhaK subunit n=1 Tax=Marinactinospora thermotolerans DSM 45154 TaxID=1122192 RepID=A0A1T4RTJ3_9ACTN|nr:dihydroxyacetone kinase subunit DhaK [Marinactinospora thermotolerans]SKA19300.1 dihydroxyacetone kinase DhaK subunit [Marinactinospora thermotolerans DSM 45154]